MSTFQFEERPTGTMSEGYANMRKMEEARIAALPIHEQVKHAFEMETKLLDIVKDLQSRLDYARAQHERQQKITGDLFLKLRESK